MLKRKVITSKIESIDCLDCQVNQTSPGDLDLYLYLPLHLKPQGQAFLLLWRSGSGQMVQLLVTFMCITEPLASLQAAACFQRHSSQVPSAFPKVQLWYEGS